MDNKPFDKETSVNLANRYIKSGYALQIIGEVQKAISYYTMSIESYPTPEAYTHLGWAYSELGDLDKAIDCCLAAIDFDPNYGNPYNDIGAYLIEMGKYDEAEEYLREALNDKKYSTPQYAYLNLGIIHHKRGEWFDSRDCFKKSLDLDPNNDYVNELYYKTICLLN